MKLLWLDLETEGLDPTKHAILEVAALIADLERPFDARDSFEAVLHDSRGTRSPDDLFEGIDPFVIDMHTKNGLWAASRESEVTLADAEEHLLRMIDKITSADRENQTTLAGSCVNFDLGFIRQWMPRLAKFLHYRVYDVSAVHIFCRSLGMPQLAHGDAHRAMADVLESIEHARQCAAWLHRR